MRVWKCTSIISCIWFQSGFRMTRKDVTILEPVYRKYKGTPYRVAVFRSGKEGNLLTSTAALLKANQWKKANIDPIRRTTFLNSRLHSFCDKDWRICLNENIWIKKANNLIFWIEFMKKWDYASKGGGWMLIEFRFKLQILSRWKRPFSMEATGLGTFKNSLIPYGIDLLPGAAIFGKNGGGKTNVIRALWLAVRSSEMRSGHNTKKRQFRLFLLHSMTTLHQSRLNLNFSIRWMASNTGMLSRQPRKKSFRNLCIMRLRGRRALVF